MVPSGVNSESIPGCLIVRVTTNECAEGSKQRTQYDIRRSIGFFLDHWFNSLRLFHKVGGGGKRIKKSAKLSKAGPWNQGALINCDIITVRWRSTTLLCRSMWWRTVSRRTKLASQTAWGFTTCITTSTRRWKVRPQTLRPLLTVTFVDPGWVCTLCVILWRQQRFRPPHWPLQSLIISQIFRTVTLE